MSDYKIAIVGLGFVGLEIAMALAKHFKVYGYDNNSLRIRELIQKNDSNLQFTKKDLNQTHLFFTSNLEQIKDANVYIIAVPTPAKNYQYPDLEPLEKISREIGSILKKNDLIIYESSVYPGTTNQICIPILEEMSQLKENKDFYVGYSPERISPSDKKHPFTRITKLISANHPKALLTMQFIYQKIISNVFTVSKIEHAEAAKMLENIQRDVNIALMNEYSKIMHAMNLNMHEIIKAATTKFNFMPYKPGLVGGHCISIDPLYIAYIAKQYHVEPELILCARKTNDSLTQFILHEMIKILLKNLKKAPPYKVGIFGIAYKENTPDLRNTLVLKFIKECKPYPIDLQIHDPYFPDDVIKNNRTFKMNSFDEMKELDLIIIFNQHSFYEKKGLKSFIEKCQEPKMMMDIPNMFINDKLQKKLNIYWSL